MRWTILVAALAACSGEPDGDPPALLDTGWFTTPVTVDPANCPDQFATWSPEDGAGNWYWRDRPSFYTKTTNQPAYTVYLQDEDGVRIPTTQVWDQAAGLSFTLDWDGYLEADTAYTLGLTDCATFREVNFTTDGLGRPLSIDAGELAGRTYLLDLVHATWVEPPVLGALIQLYFTDPILLGVRYADATQIDLLGAPGLTDDFGTVTQNTNLSSWDFPLADFGGAPFVDAQVPQIELNYDSVKAPVYDFVLQGTFSADGSEIGGAVLSGFGDTRNLGVLLQDEGNEAAVCDLATGFGVTCEPCPDGMPYCLHLRAVSLRGELVPGLILVEDP